MLAGGRPPPRARVPAVGRPFAHPPPPHTTPLSTRRLDPTESADLQLATSRQAIRKQIKARVILKKRATVHTRSRKLKRDVAVSKGRHSGFGKRRGTANARLPFKVIWMRRLRVLRRMLKKYRQAKKIDKHQYHTLYLLVKGAQYKTKKALMEKVHKMKVDAKRTKTVEEQATAAKLKASKKKEKKTKA